MGRLCLLGWCVLMIYRALSVAQSHTLQTTNGKDRRGDGACVEMTKESRVSKSLVKSWIYTLGWGGQKGRLGAPRNPGTSRDEGRKGDQTRLP